MASRTMGPVRARIHDVWERSDGRMSTAKIEAAGLPLECPGCEDGIEYWADSDGIWLDCACDSGYIFTV